MKANCPAKLNAGRKLTNHSVRKHLLKKCNDMGLAPTATVQISGHNLQSVNSYSKLNDRQQKKIATALINNDKCPEIAIQKANSPPPPPPAAADPSTCMGSPINQSQTISYKRQSAQSNLSTIFQGTTTITGGVFNFYTGENHSCPVHDNSPSRRKYRRILPIVDSDSDQLEESTCSSVYSVCTYVPCCCKISSSLQAIMKLLL